MNRARPTVIAIATALLIGTLGSAAPAAAVVATYSTSAPIILQEVPSWDLAANKNGVCTSGATHVIKNAQGTFNAANYASLAAGCGMQVIWSFPDTTNYSTGRVYTAKVAPWVNKVKNLPNTWGYLSVKEPSWHRISAVEIRALYRAYRKADPAHKVMALFGDVPHFGSTSNPYTRGMANVVMVDWYPIETTNGSNSRYLTGASKWFPKVRKRVAATSPGVPVYLMVQTHKYLRPATHKKQRPSQAQLAREVREGFGYLKAAGIAFHVWRNPNYTRDQLRDPQMVSWISALAASIKAGTFH
ncbi:MAG: hypothetical protein QOF11_1716 [Chloroflexota bacterium]|jgi:hypothetical protein|nr:hypothetical protein [Chloroflexota bacterium]